MDISSLSLPTYQLILVGILYIGYLCLIMFGGMRKKQVRLRRFVLMVLLLFWALIKTYNGIHTATEIVDLGIIIVIAIVKGTYLGRKKHVERIEGIDYIWHDFSYVNIWFLFFIGKIIITSGLQFATGTTMPLWHMIFYFCVYFTLRSGMILYLHSNAFQIQRSL